MLGLVQRRGLEEFAATGLRHIFPCEYAAEKRLVSAIRCAKLDFLEGDCK